MPAPGLPGMMPSVLPLSTVNYLGQPITAGQVPGISNGLTDLAALAAPYTMHGIPGIPSTASLVQPSQPIFLNGDMSTGVALQSKLAATLSINRSSL